ncbi:hypothetical protein ACNKXS_15050 [Christiangramia marina]|uniref:hypothetical protein n=1 Tax=Christiangramia marina TaxID=409436 RepID=UPI003AA8EE95
MRNSNLLFLLIFLPIINSYAQTESNFDHFVMSEIGKINNDKIIDSVAITQDTIDEKRPYRLEVFFGQNDKSYKLALKTDKAILLNFPGGRNVSNGENFWEIEIIDRNLWIKHELLRGHFEHKFQYRDGKFELMEYNSVASDGRGKIFYQNLDFITGIRRTQTDSYEQDKVLKKEEEFIKIEGKPDLSNFEPKSNRFY